MTRPNRPKRRSDEQPQIVSEQRRQQLGGSFADQQSAAEAAEYDAVRPRYPDQAVAETLALARSPQVGGDAHEQLPSVVEFGAGTGIFTRQLLAAGAHVHAVEPSAPMLEILLARSRGVLERGSTVQGHCASYESTGLRDGCADLVVAAQAWHWFDPAAAQAEALRLLMPRGALALIWNYLDTADPTVHRLTRIMRAGDVYRPGWKPRLDQAYFDPACRVEYRWSRTLTVTDIFRYATTLSSWLSAGSAERAKRRANLEDFLLHESGLGPEDLVVLPQITVLHTSRRR
jgi:SAM-dependent methyltransferase